MSMPTPGNDQQLLAFLQTWRQLLEQWGAMTTAAPSPSLPFDVAATPVGAQFIPPGMPLMPTGLPPMAPLVPPSPTDYTQQLFGYLQAWRQYLEQMAGARPAPPQPATANSSGSAPASSGAGANSSAPPPTVHRPPATDVGTKGQGSSDGVPTSNFASASAKVPPEVFLAPGREDSTQAPDNLNLNLNAGLLRAPSPAGRFGGPEAPAVFRPPIYDYGNMFDRLQFGSDASATSASLPTALHSNELSATGAPPPPARLSPTTLTQNLVNSPYLGMMSRATLDESPLATPTLFKSPGSDSSSR
jgi:hypothetical protein